MDKSIRHLYRPLLALIATSTLGTAQSLGTSGGPKLEMSVVRLGDGTATAEIKNVGNATFLIPTKAVGPVELQEAGVGVIEVCFVHVEAIRKRGDPGAEAKSTLGLVELRPGKAVVLKGKIPTWPPKPKVSYRISKAFGERYGTWSGELVAKWPDD